MKTSISYCPVCGYEIVDKAAFCRKCGSNLDVVDRALQEARNPVPPANKENAEAIVKELKQDIFLKALRGLITLGLSVPLFLLLLFALRSGSFVIFLPLLILLIFVVLGIADLARSYSRFRNPAAALKAFREKKEKGWLETASGSAELIDRRDSNNDLIHSPVSVTEHTTFELKDRSVSSDSPSTKKLE